jgi:hypothetical protein
MKLAGQGMNLAQMGQGPQRPALTPAQRPVMQGGPPVPQIAGAAQGAQQLTPNAMSQLLLRGLMGSG